MERSTLASLGLAATTCWETDEEARRGGEWRLAAGTHASLHNHGARALQQTSSLMPAKQAALLASRPHGRGRTSWSTSSMSARPTISPTERKPISVGGWAARRVSIRACWNPPSSKPEPGMQTPCAWVSMRCPCGPPPTVKRTSPWHPTSTPPHPIPSSPRTRHEGAQLLGHHEQEVDDVLRLARKLGAQHRVLQPGRRVGSRRGR